jgi:hypothetical protein
MNHTSKHSVDRKVLEVLKEQRERQYTLGECAYAKFSKRAKSMW